MNSSLSLNPHTQKSEKFIDLAIYPYFYVVDRCATSVNTVGSENREGKSRAEYSMIFGKNVSRDT